jgi:peroxiredoxin
MGNVRRPSATRARETPVLQVGTIAPVLDLEDTSGRPIRLDDYRATANVLVYFMRSASCPVCGSHVRDLGARAADLSDRNVTVLVAVPEGRSAAAEWQARSGVPFTVVTGVRGTAHESVGLARRVFGIMQQSGSILVDMDGVVRHSHGATMPVSSYDRKGLLAAIEALQPSRRRA